MQISNKDLVLDISVNLARVSDWCFSESSSKRARVDQFLEETREFVDQLSMSRLSERFEPTFSAFQKEFTSLLAEKDSADKEEWAEKALTWANILQHRAKLA